MLVNILNENVMIPYLDIKGPIFGIDLAPGLAGAIAERRWVKIETTTYQDAMNKKKEYLYRLQKQKANDDNRDKKDTVISKIAEPITSEIKEEIPKIGDVFEKKVYLSNDDIDIDNILENTIEENNVLPKKKIRHYRMTTLEKMKKKELTQILIDRGIATGKYAPKYYDTCEKLIGKIVATQEDETLIP